MFASHTLKHIENPLKALTEWLRITKNKGYIILVLPEKSFCFDHRRDVSDFEIILSQYKKMQGKMIYLHCLRSLDIMIWD